MLSIPFLAVLGCLWCLTTGASIHSSFHLRGNSSLPFQPFLLHDRAITFRILVGSGRILIFRCEIPFRRYRHRTSRVLCSRDRSCDPLVGNTAAVTGFLLVLVALRCVKHPWAS